MLRRFGILAFVSALVLVTGDAWAQSQPGMQDTERSATTTIYGDTGLWFVPAGEVLKDKDWSVSGYYINWDVKQGFMDISHFAGNFAYGIKGRAEIFGSVRVVTRIDRDTRPIFGNSEIGGVDNEYPYVRQGWIGNQFGDTFLGAKINLMSESRMNPVALAVRGMVKLPTGSKDNQSGTGKMDTALDVILSKEVNSKTEVSATGGFVFRGDPDDFDLSNSFRYGVGVQFPTRSALKFLAEFSGESFTSDSVTTVGTRLVADDGSIAPSISNLPSVATIMFGATWQSQKGFFAGGGLGWSATAEDRGNFKIDSSDNFGTKFGFQVRIGYHPPIAGRPVPLPPPPTPTPAPPPPQHTLTVDAQCNPCVVEVGAVANVTATSMDSIGCAITYRWTAPSGTFANAGQANTAWTAPNTPGTVVLTVTGTCPNDNMSASDTVSIQVNARPVQTFTFEDVFFDFDRYSLTDAAQRILAQAVTTLRANPTLRIRIEGHTCSIGTAEYNLALGDRRARSVMQYLTSNGIGADRLTSVSFGEENPKFDNSREETRRMNRRAAMTVQLVN
jgi:outer membrane protein OmpA-like peptidoglycan-associated protein